MKTFSIRVAVRHGWDVFKKHKRTLVASTFVIMVLGALKNYFKPFHFNLSSLIIWAAIYVVSLIVQIGWIKLALNLEDGEPVSVRDLFLHSRLFIKYFVTSLAYIILMTVGFVLLIIPGFYVMLTYGFAPVIVIDEHVTPKEAFRLSKRMTAGMRWKLLGFYIVLGLLNALGAIPFLLGLFITVPVSVLAYVHVYRLLLERAEESQNTA